MIPVFVAEIAGRAVMALNAEAEDAAQAVLSEPGVRFDLQQYKIGGAPVWNGLDAIALRPPEPAERALWEAAFHEAVAKSGAALDEAVRETWICFLVGVAPPA